MPEAGQCLAGEQPRVERRPLEIWACMVGVWGYAVPGTIGYHWRHEGWQMAKHDLERLAATYAVAERFVDRALRQDDSLFTPGRPVWALPNFEELDRLYVQAPDPGQGSFEQKLRLQVGGGSPDSIQLMAEILFVYYLPASGGRRMSRLPWKFGEGLRG